MNYTGYKAVQASLSGMAGIVASTVDTEPLNRHTGIRTDHQNNRSPTYWIFSPDDRLHRYVYVMVMQDTNKLKGIFLSFQTSKDFKVLEFMAVLDFIILTEEFRLEHQVKHYLYVCMYTTIQDTCLIYQEQHQSVKNSIKGTMQPWSEIFYCHFGYTQVHIETRRLK